MALKDLLATAEKKEIVKDELTEERIDAAIPKIRMYVSFWREYPDMFVDFLCGSNPYNFSLFFYQRLFLRAALRHR